MYAKALETAAVAVIIGLGPTLMVASGLAANSWWMIAVGVLGLVVGLMAALD